MVVLKFLVQLARQELWQRFVQADMGITDVNLVLADTGTIGIVTNEGNARLVTTDRRQGLRTYLYRSYWTHSDLLLSRQSKRQKPHPELLKLPGLQGSLHRWNRP